MTEIPEGFPGGLSDEELAATINEWTTAYSRLYGDVDGQTPDLKLALIGAALQEQSRRENEGLRTSSKRSLRVAQIALVIAFLSLVATVAIAIAE